MSSLNLDEVDNFIEKGIAVFHKHRIDSLRKLKLSTILKRKNPYLFKVKSVENGREFIKSLLTAHLSSQEETLLGDFLVKLSIFICEKAYNGKKSDEEGITIEFEKQGIYYLLVINSGPNWGNSSQIKKMKDSLRKRKETLLQMNPNTKVQSINGCCYGQERNKTKDDYLKYCGQEFWEFISGDDNLYLSIISIIGHRAKERNEDFAIEYNKQIDKLTGYFFQEFCQNEMIDWEKLLKFNSAKTT